MSFVVSAAHLGPYPRHPNPYIFDDESPSRNRVDWHAWWSVVAKSPRLREVPPGQIYFDSRKNREMPAEERLALFSTSSEQRAVEICHSMGYLIVFWHSEEDFEILTDLAKHLNELKRL